MEHELVALEHVGAEDVGGHQVGSELDPAELDVEDLAERGEELGLAEARNALEEDVALAQRADEDGVDEIALADDDLSHLGAHCGDGLGELLGRDFVVHGLLMVGD